MVRERVEANLYRTDNMAPGEMGPVLEVDPQTGQQIRVWFGPTSFVKDMGRLCRRVTRIAAPAAPLSMKATAGRCAECLDEKPSAPHPHPGGRRATNV